MAHEREMRRGATFSGCRTWRYSLLREWDPTLPQAVFIGLNPSTADETVDDPTIRRCIGFAKSWGCGSLEMLNLFAVRSPFPKYIQNVPDPVGPMNDAVIRAVCGDDPIGIIVAAWGVHGRYRDRDIEVMGLLDGVEAAAFIECLGMTKAGDPRHPLYLRADAPRVLYEGRGSALAAVEASRE